MKISKRFYGVLVAFFLLFSSFAADEVWAACTDPLPTPEADLVQIPDGTTYTSIQLAYNAASAIETGPFTLKFVSGVYIEDLVIDQGAVTFDGGYACNFVDKTGTPSSILGTITISGNGSLVSKAGMESTKVISSAQCDFDVESDWFTSIGSCTGSADDCN